MAAEMYTADRDICVTRPGLKTPDPRYVVPSTHPHAYLLVAQHHQIPLTLAAQYGLLEPETTPDTVDAPPAALPTPDDSPSPESAAPSPDAEEEPKAKSRRPVADKAVHHAEDK